MTGGRQAGRPPHEGLSHQGLSHQGLSHQGLSHRGIGHEGLKRLTVRCVFCGVELERIVALALSVAGTCRTCVYRLSSQ